MSKELLQVIQKLTTDEEYRRRFMADPWTMLSQLGISVELFRKMLPVLMTALVTGSIILSEVDPIQDPGYGWR